MYTLKNPSVYCYYKAKGVVGAMNGNTNLLKQNNVINNVLYEDVDAVKKITDSLLNAIPPKKTIVIACIGTDRSTGDSLGPLVGSFLLNKMKAPFYVYGTLDEPIHAVNLQEKLDEINARHENAFIIAIDACLGRLKNVGSVQINNGPLKPGAGVNKKLPEIGDIHINGIVNVSGFMEFYVLQNTRLSLVMKMAQIIAESLYTSSQVLERRKNYQKTNWSLL